MKTTVPTLAGMLFVGCGLVAFAQRPAAEKDTIQYEKIDGAWIYDYEPGTRLGDDIYGTLIADLEHDAPGRCSHGGPVCLEYPNGSIVAFYANTTDHNSDGWSEYAVSRDRGRTWDKYNKFEYSYQAYRKNPDRPVWVEEGLVTKDGTIVIFLTEIGSTGRIASGFVRSHEHGATWTEYQLLDPDFVGYPCATAVSDKTNYVLLDSNDGGPHVLYVSTNDGRSWSKRSTLTLDDDKWYGAMTLMADGRLLAGAYTEKDEDHFYYCISQDEGQTWGPQEKAFVDKKIRDPEVAYLSGKYYLQGRSGHSGEGQHRFVLYQSDDGIQWGSGIVISGDTKFPDGYSHNCIINRYDDDVPEELMVEYSIIYDGWDTNEYVFFIRPDPAAASH